MPARIITAPTFRLLERQLLTDLHAAVVECPPPTGGGRIETTAGASTRGLDTPLDSARGYSTSSLAPRWVVTPTATVANHFRVRLARAAGSGVVAAVRVVNLPRFTQRLAADPARSTGAPRWSPTHDLLLGALVRDLPDRSPLASLQSITGGAGLLRETFLDLAEGGFGPAHRDVLAQLAEEPTLSTLERATLGLYQRWLDALARTDTPWQPLAQQLLADHLRDTDNASLARLLGAEPGQIVRVTVHGFYEWTDVNLQLLAELAHRIDLAIYFPYHLDHHGFAFAAEVLDDLRLRLGTDLVDETAVAVPPDDGPATFFLDTFPEGTIPPAPPAFLSRQHASGPRAEAVSAALCIRRWLDAPRDPLAPEDILVVAPDAEAYRDVVEEVFTAFAIPVRVADVAAGPTPGATPPRLLARLWEDRAPAEWVLAFLRACPDTVAAQGVDPERFEQKVRELQVWGDNAWRTARHIPDLGAPEENRSVPRFDAAERRLIDELLVFVPPETSLPNSTLSIAAARAQLNRLEERWLAPLRAGLAPLREAVDALARLNSRAQIERTQLTRLLAETGGAPTLRDPLTRGVLFVPLLRARGLTARGIVLLGLAAGQLPFRIPDSPLLSELSLEQLARTARDLGHWFSLKSRVTDELTLLFLLLNTAAERVHWVVPETDADGKAVAPTPWVQRYEQRWGTGVTGPVRAAPKRPSRPRSVALAARVPRGPADQARLLAGLDDGHGAWLPPRLAVYLQPSLAAGLVPGAPTPAGRPARGRQVGAAKKRSGAGPPGRRG
ncbi:exodeoxyribonuclease V subunit gamma, partial [bacterium]|nr:exodeoxyribonuclease V subunit gamma [bacterium]